MRAIVVMLATIVALSLSSSLNGQTEADPQRAVTDPVLSGADAATLTERFEGAFKAQLSTMDPMGEVYFQVLSDDPAAAFETPVSDVYLWGKVVPAGRRTRKDGTAAGRADHLPAGLEDLLSPDRSFEARRYALTFLRREFLEETRTSVYDVRPLKDRDGFTGRVWLDERGVVMRYVGNRRRVDALLSRLVGRKGQGRFVYSGWRINVGDGQFYTTDVFVQETPTRENQATPLARGRFKVWNYGKFHADQTHAQLEVDEPTSPSRSQRPRGTSPEEGERRWNRETEDFVLEMLTREAYLAPEGTFETTARDQVIANLLAPAQLSDRIDPTVRCRVLLTSRLGVRALGHTVIISIGSLDTAGDESTVAVMLAHAVSHIALNHPLIDPKIALADRSARELLDALEPKPFKEEETNAKALELLSASLYASKLEKAGLFIDALNDMATRLPALLSRNVVEHLGDQAMVLRRSVGMRYRPVYDPRRDGHYSALPLGSRIALDRGTNQVDLLGTPLVALLGKSFGVVPPYPTSTIIESDSPSEKRSAQRTPSGSLP